MCLNISFSLLCRARRVKIASNMDGFYDQQVPFVYPESVSFKRRTAKFHLRVFFFGNVSVKPSLKFPEMPRRGRSEMPQRAQEEVHGHRAGSGHGRSVRTGGGVRHDFKEMNEPW